MKSKLPATEPTTRFFPISSLSASSFTLSVDDFPRHVTS